MENGQYIQPKNKSKNKFWTVVAVVIIVGAAIMIIWTFFSQRGRSQDNSSLQASSVASSSGTSKTIEPNLDPDNDNLTNRQEQQYGTNPQDSDTDKDGFSDGEEVANGYNPNGPGKLDIQIDKSKNSSKTENQADLSRVDFSGVSLDEVFSGNGKGYVCSITGGTSQLNTVKLSVKGKKVRQETPLNGQTLIMIIDDRIFYMSGFENGKYLKLTYDPLTGVAAGSGAQVKNGIFTNKNFVLATSIKKVECQEKAVADSRFQVADNLIVNP